MMQYITEKHQKDSNMAFTLGMGDIDFFKKINDNWGHDCGDAVLVWITRHMSEVLGEHARLCRWGGEEFIFFFPDHERGPGMRDLECTAYAAGQRSF